MHPPPPPDDTYCDAGMEAPCQNGLSVWIWIVLSLGAVALFGCWIYICWWNYQHGTPAQRCTYCEAVLSAAHADPKQSRLHGRASSSHPRLDLFEGQQCCCCLPLGVGVLLLGLVDCTRLGVALAYALDGIATYQQTDFVRFPDAQYAHLMVPHAREVAEGILWPAIIITGIKAALWLCTFPSLCLDLAAPLKALLFWLPIDLVHTFIFAVKNAQFAQVGFASLYHILSLHTAPSLASPLSCRASLSLSLSVSRQRTLTPLRVLPSTHCRM